MSCRLKRDKESTNSGKNAELWLRQIPRAFRLLFYSIGRRLIIAKENAKYYNETMITNKPERRKDRS